MWRKHNWSVISIQDKPERHRGIIAMMKTLCVAVVVLSLSSVCQPAPLTCEKLLKPADSPDFSGRWHMIAVMFEKFCDALLVKVLRPSIALDITANETQNVYDWQIKMNLFGHCFYFTMKYLYENNTLFDVNNNTPVFELLQSGCPDCTVMKRDNLSALLLYSRRQHVDTAELKEFETQGDCLSRNNLQILKSDHDYENCKPFNMDGVSDADSQEIFSKMRPTLKNMREDIIKCSSEHALFAALSTLLDDDHLLV